MKQNSSTRRHQSIQGNYLSFLQLRPIVKAQVSEYAPAYEKNEEQLTRMYVWYFAPLLRFCTYKLSNTEKATDVVADTFARTWNYLRQGNHIDNEKSFLFTTARHLIIDEYRKKKCASLDELMSSGLEITCDYGKDTCNSFDQSLILQELYKLPKTYRIIMVMRYVDDCSISHISKVVQNSANNVSVKIHRGIRQLRNSLPFNNIYG